MTQQYAQAQLYSVKAPPFFLKIAAPDTGTARAVARQFMLDKGYNPSYINVKRLTNPSVNNGFLIPT